MSAYLAAGLHGLLLLLTGEALAEGSPMRWVLVAASGASLYLVTHALRILDEESR